MVMVVVSWPSRTVSLTPVAKTNCGRFQLAGVNVSDAADTVTSLESPFEMSRTTFEAGCEESAIVNVSVVPVSLTTVLPRVCVITNPLPIGVSSSIIVTKTIASDTTSYASSDKASSTEMTALAVCVPSPAESFTPLRVIVRAEFQSLGVNVNVVGDAVTSAGLLLTILSTTFDAGASISDTAMVSVPRFSARMVVPPDSTMEIPASTRRPSSGSKASRRKWPLKRRCRPRLPPNSCVSNIIAVLRKSRTEHRYNSLLRASHQDRQAATLTRSTATTCLNGSGKNAIYLADKLPMR